MLKVTFQILDSFGQRSIIDKSISGENEHDKNKSMCTKKNKGI